MNTIIVKQSVPCQQKRHIERAFLCNLLEEEEEELPVIGNCVSINFKPYEIHTIKLYME